MRTEVIAALLLACCADVRRPQRALPEQFRAVTLTRDALERSTLEGRPWVISVWRPGCAPCMRQLVQLDALKKAHPRAGIGFIALSLQAEEDEVMDAAGRAEVDSTLAIAAGEAMGPLGLREIPATVFIDARATIVAIATGEHKAASLEPLLAEAAK